MCCGEAIVCANLKIHRLVKHQCAKRKLWRRCFVHNQLSNNMYLKHNKLTKNNDQDEMLYKVTKTDTPEPSYIHIGKCGKASA